MHQYLMSDHTYRHVPKKHASAGTERLMVSCVEIHQRSWECTVWQRYTYNPMHGTWSAQGMATLPTIHNFTTALAALYCGTSTRLAFVLCKWCGVLKHHGMQSTEHCTGGRTKLYVLTTCCTVRNTHAERFREAMAEEVIFEADLWDVDSLSRTNTFRFSHWVNIGVQHDGFPAPVPSWLRSSLRLKSTAKFFLQAPSAVCICNDGRRKVDRRGTSAGRIS